MHIVTDRGADLTPEFIKEYNIHFADLLVTLDGKTYHSGTDLDGYEFYKMLEKSKGYPTTSMPSVGDFQQLYEKLAEEDPDIFSIHISPGLSGTLTSAKAAADLVKNARVTFWDTKTLSAPMGWQVEAAARMLRAGKPIEYVFNKLEQIREVSQGLFTLNDLRYLIHGGRISHISGLMASILNIKPIIGLDKAPVSKYTQLGRYVTFGRALTGMIKLIEDWYGNKEKIRVQLVHGNNPDAIEQIKNLLTSAFDCIFEPTLSIAAVLGAHTGPTMVGMAVAPLSLFNYD